MINDKRKYVKIVLVGRFVCEINFFTICIDLENFMIFFFLCRVWSVLRNISIFCLVLWI